jgi:hypothetical protein
MLLEEQEPLAQPITVGPTAEWKGNNHAAAWLQYLDAHGAVSYTPGQKFKDVRVPRWVNDVLRAAVPREDGAPPDPATLRLLRRAVRAAGRSPAFRAWLAEAASSVRAAKRPAQDLVTFLYSYPWQNLRPAGTGNSGAPSKTGDAALDAGDGLP